MIESVSENPDERQRRKIRSTCGRGIGKSPLSKDIEAKEGFMTTLGLITLGLAIWGSVVGTLTLFWKIYSDVIHHGRLKVWCERRRIIDPVIEDRKFTLAFYITNIGKEAIWVAHVGGSIKGQLNRFTLTSFQETKLDPGQRIIEYVPINILDENILSLEVTDSLGRFYTCPKKQVKRLIEEHKKDDYQSQ